MLRIFPRFIFYLNPKYIFIKCFFLSSEPTQGKLWEFIRDLLRNRETCPSLICWEDYSQAKFRFVRSDEVAKRWGSRKGNTKMTYEKLSRAMRFVNTDYNDIQYYDKLSNYHARGLIKKYIFFL